MPMENKDGGPKRPLREDLIVFLLTFLTLMTFLNTWLITRLTSRVESTAWEEKYRRQMSDLSKDAGTVNSNEFADIALSDVLLGIASGDEGPAVRITVEQARAIEPLLPEMKGLIAGGDGARLAALGERVKQILMRDQLIALRQLKDKTRTAPRDDARNLKIAEERVRAQARMK